MAKQTDRQKLARQISEEKGIKYKSALRYIQRATATGNKQKIQKPTFKGLSEKTAKKAKRTVKREKKLAEKPKQQAEQPRPERQPEKIRRANFRFTGTKVLKLSGNFTHGSDDDVRDRILRIEAPARLANYILNSDSVDEAADKFLGFVPYIRRMNEFYYFEIDGQSFTDEDFGE